MSTRTTLDSAQMAKEKRAPLPTIRKVNDYLVFYDEVLGKGQFGTVVKAQLAVDVLCDA